jgi:hypothetical protein
MFTIPDVWSKCPRLQAGSVLRDQDFDVCLGDKFM